MATGSTQRVSGMIALVAALLMALIIPRVLEPPLAGRASAEPPANPPPIGDCILFGAVDGDLGGLGGDLGSIDGNRGGRDGERAAPRDETDSGATQVVRSVPCDEPHNGEIAWAASSRSADQALAGSYEAQWATAGSPAAAAAAKCSEWANGYVGTGIAQGANSLGSWLPIPPYSVSSIVRGPTADYPERLGWFACVVSSPGGESYRGSVRGDGGELGGRRPGAYATCLALGEVAVRTLEYSTCGQPHRIEFMATLLVTQQMAEAGRVDVELSNEELLTQCRQAVSQLTGSPDPTYAGRLSVSVETVSQRGIEASEPLPNLAVGQLIRPDCLVELVGDGVLTDSLIGLGAGDLPVG